MGHYKGRKNRQARRKNRIKNWRTKVRRLKEHVIACGNKYEYSHDPQIAATQQQSKRAMVLCLMPTDEKARKQVQKELGLT